jgi:dolichol-phosphate mannosyltransferase
MNSQSIRFSLIVPTFNEAENILPFMTSVKAALGDYPFELIVVDDNSPDGTWRLVGEFSTSHSWTKLIRRTEDRGLSSAVVRGIAEASGEFLGVMDADGQHDERILPQLVAALEGGAELALGSRRVPGGGMQDWPWYRRVTSSVATGMAKLFLGVRLSDPMSGYFALRRSVFERCRKALKPRGYKILLELAYKGHPTKVVDVPFVFKDRRAGVSKLTGAVVVDYLRMLVSLRFGGS